MTAPPLSGNISRIQLAQWQDQYRRRRRRRWCVIGALVAVLAATWSGMHLRGRAQHEAVSQPLRQEARAGDPRIPAVVWPRGLPDHGVWADDPWVRALREFHLVHAAAFNSGRIDGRTDLLRLASPRRVMEQQGGLESAWRNAHRDGATPALFPGPAPFEVLDVVADEQGDEADVLICIVRVDGGAWADVPAEVLGPVEGSRRLWRMVRGADGHIRNVFVQDDPARGTTEQTCTISDIHYGIFDPQPGPLVELPPDEGLGPAGGAELRVGELETPEDVARYLDELMSEGDRLREMAEREARR